MGNRSCGASSALEGVVVIAVNLAAQGCRETAGRDAEVADAESRPHGPVEKSLVDSEGRKHGDASQTSGPAQGRGRPRRGSGNQASLGGLTWPGKPPLRPPRWIRDRRRGFDLRPGQKGCSGCQTAGDPPRPAAHTISTSWESPRQPALRTRPTTSCRPQRKGATPQALSGIETVAGAEAASATPQTGLPRTGSNQLVLVSLQGAPASAGLAQACDLHQGGMETASKHGVYTLKDLPYVCVMDRRHPGPRCALPC